MANPRRGQRIAGGCEAEHVKLFVVLALGTAARVTSILELTWSRVDLERRIIDLRDPNKPKTSKGRARVPINDTLLEHLKQAHQFRETKYVIEWAGRPNPLDQAWLSRGHRESWIGKRNTSYTEAHSSDLDGPGRHSVMGNCWIFGT